RAREGLRSVILSARADAYEIACKLCEARQILDCAAEMRGSDGRAGVGLHAKAREEVTIALRAPAFGVRELRELVEGDAVLVGRVRAELDGLRRREPARVRPAAIQDISGEGQLQI